MAASFLKQCLTLVGARLSCRRLHHFQLAVNYMKLGRWMADHHFRVSPRVCNRKAIFETVAKQVCDRRVLYLEFGVYQGASMRYWSGALRHPNAMLHGFDCFEGLPEDFDGMGGNHLKGSFDVGGQPPKIDDPRVRFFKGYFDQVLPTYQVPAHDVLVMTLDADLYSSTICVLRHLKPHIRQGTYLYFDDLSRPEHEPRAFDEFIEESGLKFETVCVERTLNRVAFQCL